MGSHTEVEPRSMLLTAREHDILILTADGCSAPVIARRLDCSAATVRTDLLSMFEKLGVTNRASAIDAGLQAGLL
jgi:two-component system, NarL family, nitrate/nitrite response regulator NarL